MRCSETGCCAANRTNTQSQRGPGQRIKSFGLQLKEETVKKCSYGHIDDWGQRLDGHDIDKPVNLSVRAAFRPRPWLQQLAESKPLLMQ